MEKGNLYRKIKLRWQFFSDHLNLSTDKPGHKFRGDYKGKINAG